MKPIEIENLDQHLKPLQVDGVSTGIEISTEGRRYGLDPEHSQINGSYFIDNARGLIKFGSA